MIFSQIVNFSSVQATSTPSPSLYGKAALWGARDEWLKLLWYKGSLPITSDSLGNYSLLCKCKMQFLLTSKKKLTSLSSSNYMGTVLLFRGSTTFLTSWIFHTPTQCGGPASSWSMRWSPAACYHQAHTATGKGGLSSLVVTAATTSTGSILELLCHSGHLRHQARKAQLPETMFGEQHSHFLPSQINYFWATPDHSNSSPKHLSCSPHSQLQSLKEPNSTCWGNDALWEHWWCSYEQINALSIFYVWNLVHFSTWSPK